MSKVITTLDQAITKLNTLYNTSSTPPTSGDEDYIVWTDLFNTAINLWENEEGMMWRELFVRLADAPDGTKTTTTATTYTVPSLFRFPSSAYVWLGTGTNKTPYRILKQEEVQLYEGDTGNWCYFLLDSSPTLEFNPNLTITSGQTISYNYYKYATALTTGTDTLEMSDPMYAVYYALSELKKEEGDVSAFQIALQKMESMRTRNFMASDFMQNTTRNPAENSGLGV